MGFGRCIAGIRYGVEEKAVLCEKRRVGVKKDKS
jgi:hypothetical protein